MTSNNEKQVALSPIQESSDLDLSFIVSQLSSVSGEITDRTLEELLRDAECQPPSLSWCRPNQPSDPLVTKPDLSRIVDNTNMFKTAIDTLSEISTRVQETLTLDEGSADQAATYRLPTSARSRSNSTKSDRTINVDSKSLCSKSDHGDRKSTSSTPHKQQTVRNSPKRITSQFTMNAAARIYGKRLVAGKQSKTQAMFVPTSKPVNVTVTAGCNKPKSGMLSNGKSADTRTCENKYDRDLWEENNRLRSQIANMVARLNAPSLPPSTTKTDQCDVAVVEQLRQFDEKLSSIREAYQLQLDKFNEKFEALEKLCQRPVIHDVQVQTDSNETNQVNSTTTEVPKLNFDDLVLDSNLPWSKQSAVGDQTSRKSLGADKITGRSCKSCTGFCDGGQKNLLNTIRKLQTELDVEKKVKKRLEVQLKSSKPRHFAKNVIKRQAGTQTIGLGACNPQQYDPAALEPSNNLVTENEDLKKKIENLVKEVENLNEQKTKSLRLLQIKHEEEIEVLLEEKMQLAKKLDAVQNWLSF